MRRFLFVFLIFVSISCARQRPTIITLKPPTPVPPVVLTQSYPVTDLLLLRPEADRRPQLRAQIEDVIQRYELDDAQWGIKIISIDRNEVLYEKNPRTPVIPASNMKIVTAAAALLRLGPDFRYETKLITDGPIEDGRLLGNLAVIGSGDPTISSRMLEGDPVIVFRDWAEELREAGIRKIEGSVVGFDSLQFNENVVVVRVHPGRSGRLASVRLYPDTRYFRVRNGVITRPGHSNRFVAYRSQNTIVVRGRIGTRDSSDVRYITVDEPAEYFAAVLKDTLEKRGIRSKGFRRASIAETELLRSNPERFQVVSTHSSLPLNEIVTEMMKVSQNLLAESLAKTIGTVESESGSYGAQDAVRRILSPLGITPQELSMQDGSGLSSSNFVTANLITQILIGMTKNPYFQNFYNSFPIAGIDGTLRNRMIGTLAAGNVHAKTGYIRGVRSLSGYVQTKDQEHLVFSLITNHFNYPIRGIDSAHEEICELLARFSRK